MISRERSEEHIEDRQLVQGPVLPGENGYLNEATQHSSFSPQVCSIKRHNARINHHAVSRTFAEYGELSLANSFIQQFTLWRKLGYAMGGLGTDLAFTTISFYLIFYLTTVANIPPMTAGLLVGVPKIILIPLDPLVGVLTDRVRSRFGRRRLFLLVCGPLFGLLFFMQFYSPIDLSTQALIVYWWIVQFAYTANFSLLMVSYNAMEAELSSSSTERMQLVSMRQGLGILGSLAGSALTLVLVSLLGGGRTGFNRMGMLFGAIISCSFLTVFARTKPETPTRGDSPSFRQEARLTLRLKPFQIQLGVTFLITLSSVVSNAMVVFYADYVHDLADLLPLFMLLSSATALVSIFGWNWLARRWDRRRVFAIGLVMQVMVLLGLRFAPYRSMELLWPLVALTGVSSTTSIFPRAMLTDVVAYDRSRQGRSRAGNIVGIWSLGNRAGQAIGNALAGWLLALAGYHAEAVVTPQLQEGLRMILGYVPSAFCLVIIPLLMLFTLSRAEMERIEETNRQQT